MEDWPIFSNDEFGRPASLEQLFEWMQHLVEEHDAEIRDVVNVLIDMIRPGTSENSHDVKQMFYGAMYAQGYGEVANRFASIWLNIMPWGVGFAIAVEHEFEFYALSKEAQRAVMESLAVVLRAGDCEAAVTDDNRITMKFKDGEESSVDMEAIVKQFRTSMEQELGPDAPNEGDEGNESIRKWIP